MSTKGCGGRGRNEGNRGGKPFYSGRGNGRGSSNSSAQSKTSGTGYKTGATKNRKVLADYVYEISSTSAQDYPVTTKFILNEIQDTYKEGHHVVECSKAMQTRISNTSNSKQVIEHYSGILYQDART
jgi:hypothetical protein